MIVPVVQYFPPEYFILLVQSIIAWFFPKLAQKMGTTLCCSGAVFN